MVHPGHLDILPSAALDERYSPAKALQNCILLFCLFFKCCKGPNIRRRPCNISQLSSARLGTAPRLSSHCTVLSQTDEPNFSGCMYVQAGTLSGNPLAMVAGLKTLEILDRPGTYEYLEKITDRLITGLLNEAKEAGHEVCGGHISGMTLHSAETVLRCYRLVDCPGAAADHSCSMACLHLLAL